MSDATILDRPTPWMSARDVHCLKSILLDGLMESQVFEWGSGGSTLFFSPLVRDWISIEHKREWADQVAPRLGANATLILAEDAVSYLDPFPNLEIRKFDLIIVDGIMREICLHEAKKHLKKDGICILHDARRAAYAQGWAQWEWKMRISDDLMILARAEPKKALLRVLRKFDLRGQNTGSYPWHASHFAEIPPDVKVPYCGYPYARR